MKTIKVSEATNIQLDWLVAKCEGLDPNTDYHAPKRYGLFSGWREANGFGYAIKNYTADPAQMWPIIEREGINLRAIRKGGHSLHGMWLAAYDHGNTGSMVKWVKRESWPKHYLVGPTALIAAARCYVVSKLGEEVEVPEELT